MESNHYTKEELKEMVLTGAFSSNSVLGTDHVFKK